MMVKLLDDLKRGHFPECIWRIHPKNNSEIVLKIMLKLRQCCRM